MFSHTEEASYPVMMIMKFLKDHYLRFGITGQGSYKTSNNATYISIEGVDLTFYIYHNDETGFNQVISEIIDFVET